MVSLSRKVRVSLHVPVHVPQARPPTTCVSPTRTSTTAPPPSRQTAPTPPGITATAPNVPLKVLPILARGIVNHSKHLQELSKQLQPARPPREITLFSPSRKVISQGGDDQSSCSCPGTASYHGCAPHNGRTWFATALKSDGTYSSWDYCGEQCHKHGGTRHWYSCLSFLSRSRGHQDDRPGCLPHHLPIGERRQMCFPFQERLESPFMSLYT